MLDDEIDMCGGCDKSQLLVYKDKINEIMARYNRNFDKLIFLNSFPLLYPNNSAITLQTLNKLMKTFCKPNNFISWSAPPSLFFDTVPGVRFLYSQILAGFVFKNVSRHIVTQPVIAFSNSNHELQAAYNASIVQNALINFSGDGVTYTPVESIGHYQHTFIKAGNRWCMSKFISYTTSFFEYNATALVADFNSYDY
jgi:hypothetical protein